MACLICRVAPLTLTLTLMLTLMLTLTLTLTPAASEAAQSPPRLPASPRYFARSVRAVSPGTAVSLQGGGVWGGRVDGVEQEQLCLAFEGELAYRWIGLFFAAPLQVDRARTEGVYGPGEASVAGAGDLRFGLDLLLHRFRRWGSRWTLGAGSQLSAPTGGARAVWPAAPHLGAPRHVFGPASWTVAGGAALALEPTDHLTVQLNLDLIGYIRDARDQPFDSSDWLFGAAAATAAYQPLPWLVPLLQIDLQLELLGRGQRRQLLFVTPALRLSLLAHLDVDLGVRIPVRKETVDEHRFSVGLSVRLALPDLLPAVRAGEPRAP